MALSSRTPEQYLVGRCRHECGSPMRVAPLVLEPGVIVHSDSVQLGSVGIASALRIVLGPVRLRALLRRPVDGRGQSKYSRG
jgi:hypothetical protein